MDNRVAVIVLPNETVLIDLVTCSRVLMLAGELQFLYGTLELSCTETLVVATIHFGVTILRSAFQPHGSATMGVAMAEPCITPLRHEQ